MSARQSPTSQATTDPTYRVFLEDGTALPTYGAAAFTPDRVVFNLLIRQDGSGPHLQLMSLPRQAVDVERTERYTESLEAARYATTRGEADYVEITGETSRALEALAATTEPKARLVLAQDARARLMTWSREHHYYRARDVQKLVALFDEVINELRIAAGESAFSLDLVSGAVEPSREPRLPAPSLRESIELALSAARAADVGEERVAVLRAAAESLGPDDGVEDLREAVAARLRDEERIAEEYRILAADLQARAEEARGRGDTAAIERLRAELARRDRQLGSRRPQETRALAVMLEGAAAAARIHLAALEHYEANRQSLLAYERQIRPALSGLDGLTPVLNYLRDGRAMAFERVINAESRLSQLLQEAHALVPPGDLASVHATIVSALGMAREACARRRLAVVTGRRQFDQEASSAAAGALLLTTRAREDLVVGLFPPKPR